MNKLTTHTLVMEISTSVAEDYTPTLRNEVINISHPSCLLRLIHAPALFLDVRLIEPQSWQQQDIVEHRTLLLLPLYLPCFQ